VKFDVCRNTLLARGIDPDAELYDVTLEDVRITAVAEFYSERSALTSATTCASLSPIRKSSSTFGAISRAARAVCWPASIFAALMRANPTAS
jgi:hypothetical protein